jgi:hypothetical protein
MAYPMAYVMEYAGGIFIFDGKENMCWICRLLGMIYIKIPIYYGSNHEMTVLKHYLKNGVVQNREYFVLVPILDEKRNIVSHFYEDFEQI